MSIRCIVPTHTRLQLKSNIGEINTHDVLSDCPFYCTITFYFSNNFHYNIDYFILEISWVSHITISTIYISYGFTIIKFNF